MISKPHGSFLVLAATIIVLILLSIPRPAQGQAVHSAACQNGPLTMVGDCQRDNRSDFVEGGHSDGLFANSRRGSCSRRFEWH